MGDICECDIRVGSSEDTKPGILQVLKYIRPEWIEDDIDLEVNIAICICVTVWYVFTNPSELCAAYYI